MKRIIFAAALCCMASALAAQPHPGRSPRPAPSVPHHVMGNPARRASLFNQPVYTFYDINSQIADGACTDESWCRPASGSLIDPGYSPVLPVLPEEFHAPTPTKDHPGNPFLDNTRSIFSSRTRSFGSEGSFENASDTKEVVAVELFGYSRLVPVDIVDAVRFYTAEGLLRRGRHYVVDAQSELGTVYNGEPIYYGGERGQFHFTERMEKLYQKGVRYVVSGVVMAYYTHMYYATPTSKNPTFETMVTVFLTAYDLDTRTILQTKLVNERGSGNKPETADLNAVKSISSDAFHLSNDNFKYITGIAALGAPEKKGKIKTCTIYGGLEMGLEKTDIFWVYSPYNLEKKLGKVKVTGAGDGMSECSITGGWEDVTAAFQKGERLILLSEGQALF